MRALRRVVVTLASTLCALLASELLLRACAPLPRWNRPVVYRLDGGRRLARVGELRLPGEARFRPGVVYETCYDLRFGAGRPYMDERGCVLTSINAAGWRGPLVAPERADGTFRFLAVGDSLTFGQGVPFEAAWPSVLARLLAEALPRAGITRVPEAVNLGISAFNLTEIRATVASEVPRYRPDLVIYGFFLNDAWSPAIEARAVAGPARAVRGVVASRQRGLAAFSELWRRVLLVRATRSAPVTGALEAAYAPDSDNWRRCAEDLRAIHATVAASGADLLVVLLPQPAQRDGRNAFETSARTPATTPRSRSAPMDAGWPIARTRTASSASSSIASRSRAVPC